VAPQAKAEARRDGAKLHIFVELRVPNYLGGTYRLAYDREQDQLRGTYFQPSRQRGTWFQASGFR